MALDLNSIGRTAGPVEIAWTPRDVMLYALAVGAGQEDPRAELALTTENTEGVNLQILPPFALPLVQNANVRVNIGDIDKTKVVHAEQGLTLHRSMPVQGHARISSVVSSIQDKGSGALVAIQSTAVDGTTNEALFTSQSKLFIRGAGGFSGTAARPSSPPTAIYGPPDFERSVSTREDQALLYRLCGDRNPLHSDPAFATRAGFARPILHGLCTYGISARVLLQHFAPGAPERLKSIDARFTRPVLPGETLRIQAWLRDGTIRFRTLGASAAPVIDLGVLHLHDVPR